MIPAHSHLDYVRTLASLHRDAAKLTLIFKVLYQALQPWHAHTPHSHSPRVLLFVSTLFALKLSLTEYILLVSSLSLWRKSSTIFISSSARASVLIFLLLSSLLPLSNVMSHDSRACLLFLEAMHTQLWKKLGFSFYLVLEDFTSLSWLPSQGFEGSWMSTMFLVCF